MGIRKKQICDEVKTWDLRDIDDLIDELGDIYDTKEMNDEEVFNLK